MIQYFFWKYSVQKLEPFFGVLRKQNKICNGILKHKIGLYIIGGLVIGIRQLFSKITKYQGSIKTCSDECGNQKSFITLSRIIYKSGQVVNKEGFFN